MDGIWDPNSWGQFIGGTSSKNGRDKGFTDGSHIAGIAIRIAKCKPHMMCGNETMHALPPTKWQRGDAGSTGEGAAPATASGTSGGALKCYTAPFVKCGDIESEEQTDGTSMHSRTLDPLELLALPQSLEQASRLPGRHCDRQGP